MQPSHRRISKRKDQEQETTGPCVELGEESRIGWLWCFVLETGNHIVSFGRRKPPPPPPQPQAECLNYQGEEAGAGERVRIRRNQLATGKARQRLDVSLSFSSRWRWWLKRWLCTLPRSGRPWFMRYDPTDPWSLIAPSTHAIKAAHQLRERERERQRA